MKLGTLVPFLFSTKLSQIDKIMKSLKPNIRIFCILCKIIKHGLDWQVEPGLGPSQVSQ